MHNCLDVWNPILHCHRPKRITFGMFWRVEQGEGKSCFYSSLVDEYVVRNDESKCEDTYNIGRVRHLRRTNSLELDTTSQIAISNKHNQ